MTSSTTPLATHSVFESLHRLSHPGIHTTQGLITSRFVWPGSMLMSVVGPVPLCSAKVPRSTDTQLPLSHHSRPSMLDFTSSTSISLGHYHLLVDLHTSSPAYDQFTRWPEAIPLTSITAEAVAQAFLSGWISRFGVPSTIITDRGRQFESHLWSNLMSIIGSKRGRTTAYHPQTNGMVE